MLGDLMSSVQPIEIKIFGNDADKLQELSRNVAGIVEKVNGTADVFDGIVMAGPSSVYNQTNAKLAQFGFTPQSLQLQLQTALQGNVTNTTAAIKNSYQISGLCIPEAVPSVFRIWANCLYFCRMEN